MGRLRRAGSSLSTRCAVVVVDTVVVVVVVVVVPRVTSRLAVTHESEGDVVEEQRREGRHVAEELAASLTRGMGVDTWKGRHVAEELAAGLTRGMGVDTWKGRHVAEELAASLTRGKGGTRREA